MKRYGNLFDKICDIDNIRLAHKNARKRKTHYKEVKEIDKDIDKYCYKLKELLESGKFKNSEYEVFTKNDKGKVREIYKLPYFPDRMVHHAIVQVVEPIWKSTLIKDTYQSIKGRGLHKAIRKIKKNVYSSKENLNYLKIDISKFYPSIDNNILKCTIRRKIKCKKTLALLDEIINSTVGVPIGNYLSQYFGNLYLSRVDHYVKETCKIKLYFRYCDDIVAINPEKSNLHALKHKLRDMLKIVKLSIKASNCIRPISNGLDFLGVVVYNTYTQLRKTIKKKYVYNMRNLCDDKVIASYNGWLMTCNAHNLKSKYENIRRAA